MITETTKDKIIEALLELHQCAENKGDATEGVDDLKKECDRLQKENMELKAANHELYEHAIAQERRTKEEQSKSNEARIGAGEFAMQVQELKAELAKANRQHGITKTTLNMYKEFIELHGLTLPTSVTWAKIKEGLKDTSTFEDIEEQVKQENADEGHVIDFKVNKTLCPYGCKVLSTDKPIKVGDIMCRGCEHFKGWSEDEVYVMCNNALSL